MFERVGCAECHMPKLGNVSGIYSDLLLRDMVERIGCLIVAGHLKTQFVRAGAHDKLLQCRGLSAPAEFSPAAASGRASLDGAAGAGLAPGDTRPGASPSGR